MKKGLAIIILTIISTANLTANDILTLFSKWENASKIDRIHIGNELLEKVHGPDGAPPLREKQ